MIKTRKEAYPLLKSIYLESQRGEAAKSLGEPMPTQASLPFVNLCMQYLYGPRIQVVLGVKRLSCYETEAQNFVLLLLEIEFLVVL